MTRNLKISAKLLLISAENRKKKIDKKRLKLKNKKWGASTRQINENLFLANKNRHCDELLRLLQLVEKTYFTKVFH